MELTFTDFEILGLSLEWFFFGMLSVNSQAQIAIWLKQSNVAPFQDSILEYLRSIYNTADHNKALIGRKISFSMPFGSYML